MENIFENLTKDQLLQSLEAEIAKSSNELKCAEADLNKAKSRIKFALSIIHYIKDQD
jgi:hypothetical protein